MFQHIELLKAHGYTPDVIFDIGAHHGLWTKECKTIYPNAEYHLFEAIDYPELKNYTLMEPSTTTCHITLLNDTCSEVDWYQQKNTGDSMFREKTIHFVNCDIIKKQSITLDKYCQNAPINLNEKENIFIKIDCQGAELPILRGASSLLSKVDFILLELPFFGKYNNGVPSFLEHIQAMDALGYIVYDMCDVHYMHGFCIQLDILFIKKTHSFNQRVQRNILGQL